MTRTVSGGWWMAGQWMMDRWKGDQSEGAVEQWLGDIGMPCPVSCLISLSHLILTLTTDLIAFYLHARRLLSVLCPLPLPVPGTFSLSHSTPSLSLHARTLHGFGRHFSFWTFLGDFGCFCAACVTNMTNVCFSQHF